MLNFYYMPPETFRRGVAPFSILLADGESFDISTLASVADENLDVEALYLATINLHSTLENGCYHFSAVSCEDKNFTDTTILSIDENTGDWMLRKPFSAVYPENKGELREALQNLQDGQAFILESLQDEDREIVTKDLRYENGRWIISSFCFSSQEHNLRIKCQVPRFQALALIREHLKKS